MKYPNPPSALRALKLIGTTNGVVEFGEERGTALQVSCLGGLGWQIETRFDLLHSGVRQPYTGRQEELEPTELAAEQAGGGWSVRGPDGVSLSITPSGGFELKRGDATLFATADEPFRRFDEPVALYEKLRAPHFFELIGTPSLSWTTGTKTYASSMVRFRYPRPKGPVFGIPGATGEFNRNGYRFELYNTDTSTHNPDRTPLYQSWPIVFQRSADEKSWIALFHDNPSRTFVDIGDFFPDEVVFESVTGNTRVFLCEGKTLAEVSRKMAGLLGVGMLPPAWSLGYQQCRWSYMSTNEVRDVVSRFEEESIPLDAVYFDIDYMDEFRIFTTNKERFGDLEACLNELKSKHIRSVFIVDPGVKVDPEYPLYNRLVEEGECLKDVSGSTLQITCWPGQAVLPDFRAESTREIWKNELKEWLGRFPFEGIWNDMNEPANFARDNEIVAQSLTKRGKYEPEYNLYGYYMAKASFDGWQAVHEKENPFIITRSGYPGVQNYSIIWHGDNHAWWEHLRLAMNTAIAYSLSGAYYTGADVPGFSQNAPDDLAIRFFQLAAFLPLFRGHSAIWAKYKEPYQYESWAVKHIKEAIHLRYSLLREWLSHFGWSYESKEPPLMPVFDVGSHAVLDQFMLFDRFLVAPVVTRDQRERLVYLPEGRWYALGDTTKTFEGGRSVVVPVDISSIPVFVREGSIVTRNVPGRNVYDTLAGEERFEVYPDKDGKARGLWKDLTGDVQEFHELVVDVRGGSVKKQQSK